MFLAVGSSAAGGIVTVDLPSPSPRSLSHGGGKERGVRTCRFAFNAAALFATAQTGSALQTLSAPMSVIEAEGGRNAPANSRRFDSSDDDLTTDLKRLVGLTDQRGFPQSPQLWLPAMESQQRRSLKLTEAQVAALDNLSLRLALAQSSTSAVPLLDASIHVPDLQQELEKLAAQSRYFEGNQQSFRPELQHAIANQAVAGVGASPMFMWGSSRETSASGQYPLWQPPVSAIQATSTPPFVRFLRAAAPPHSYRTIDGIGGVGSPSGIAASSVAPDVHVRAGPIFSRIRAAVANGTRGSTVFIGGSQQQVPFRETHDAPMPLYEIPFPRDVSNLTRVLLTSDSSASTSTEQMETLAKLAIVTLVPWLLVLILTACYCDNYGMRVHVGDFTPIQGQWTHALPQCLHDKRLCLFSCLCGPVRWAMNMRAGGFMGYWTAFLLAIFLITLGCLTLGIGFIPLLCMTVYYRQEIKNLFGIESYTTFSIVSDCFIYALCSVCAITQEAFQLEIAQARGYPVLPAVQEASDAGSGGRTASDMLTSIARASASGTGPQQ